VDARPLSLRVAVPVLRLALLLLVLPLSLPVNVVKTAAELEVIVAVLEVIEEETVLPEIIENSFE
jgi:hypothetical protein